ncbi:ATP-dependent Clp protease adaptor ClpS [Amycolatopsis sp. NPDC089917]|uniref:ATP-dependent Clp protease adaptor ClpS n=1 Tax=Amycolatopsis sp. NPDC089917 TaxID=3155187 RepID=UPI00344626F8
MRQGESWIIEIHNDHINTHAGVTLVLSEVLGYATETAYRVAGDIDRSGRVDLTPCPWEQGEKVVAALQVHGLRARLRHA